MLKVFGTLVMLVLVGMIFGAFIMITGIANELGVLESLMEVSLKVFSILFEFIKGVVNLFFQLIWDHFFAEEENQVAIVILSMIKRKIN